MNKLFIGLCILAVPVTGRAMQQAQVVVPTPEFIDSINQGEPRSTYMSSVGKVTVFTNGSIRIDNYLGKGGIFKLSRRLTEHVELDAQGTPVKSSQDRRPYVDRGYERESAFGFRRHKDDTLEYYYRLLDKQSNRIIRGLSILYPDKNDTVVDFRVEPARIEVTSVKPSQHPLFGNFFELYKAVIKGNRQQVHTLLQIPETLQEGYDLLTIALEKYLQAGTNEQRENFQTIVTLLANAVGRQEYILYIAIKTANSDLVARVLREYQSPLELTSRLLTGNTLLTEALITASGQLKAEQRQNIHMIIKQLLAAGAQPTADEIKMAVTVPGGGELLKIFVQASGRAVFDALKNADRALLDRLLADMQKRGTIQVLNTMTNDAGQTPLVYALTLALDVSHTDADRFQKLLYAAQSLINQSATLDNPAGNKFLNEHGQEYRKKLLRYLKF